MAKIVFKSINKSPMSKAQKNKRISLVTPAFEAFINSRGTLQDRREISTVFNTIVFLSMEPEEEILEGDVDAFLTVCRTNIVNTARRFYGDKSADVTDDEVEVFIALYTLYLDVLDNVGSGYIEKAEEEAVKRAKNMSRSESLHDRFSAEATSAPT